jgi:hypothetical protein
MCTGNDAVIDHVLADPALEAGMANPEFEGIN